MLVERRNADAARRSRLHPHGQILLLLDVPAPLQIPPPSPRRWREAPPQAAPPGDNMVRGDSASVRLCRSMWESAQVAAARVGEMEEHAGEEASPASDGPNDGGGGGLDGKDCWLKPRSRNEHLELAARRWEAYSPGAASREGRGGAGYGKDSGAAMLEGRDGRQHEGETDRRGLGRREARGLGRGRGRGLAARVSTARRTLYTPRAVRNRRPGSHQVSIGRSIFAELWGAS